MTSNCNTQTTPAAAPAIQGPRPSGGTGERPNATGPAPEPARDPAGQPSQPAAAPTCPACGKAMRLRTAKKGPRAGSQFWGCTGYPDCRKTLPA